MLAAAGLKAVASEGRGFLIFNNLPSRVAMGITRNDVSNTLAWGPVASEHLVSRVGRLSGPKAAPALPMRADAA